MMTSQQIEERYNAKPNLSPNLQRYTELLERRKTITDNLNSSMLSYTVSPLRDGAHVRDIMKDLESVARKIRKIENIKKPLHGIVYTADYGPHLVDVYVERVTRSYVYIVELFGDYNNVKLSLDSWEYDVRSITRKHYTV